MKRLVLLGTGLLVATLLVTGGNASRTVRPRVGFVSYPGTVPTRHTLAGLPLVGFLRAERQLPIRGRVAYVGPTQGPGAVLASFARQDYNLVVAPLDSCRFFELYYPTPPLSRRHHSSAEHS